MGREDVDYRQQDQILWDEELAEFVPCRVFDVHIHMFDPSNMADPSSTESTGRTTAHLATLQAWAKRLYAGRDVHFLVLGIPVPGIDPARHAAWQAEQLRGDPMSRFSRLATPRCSVRQIEEDVRAFGAVGLKVYRSFSVTGGGEQCRIVDFLPHEQLELADEMGLWVTLHLSRVDACADEVNLNDLEEFTTKRYPRIKWILAHCARSFTYWAIRKGIGRLKEMPNVWFDLSAVTDLRPMLTLFQNVDISRIFYGTDGLDATYFHGAYCAMGRSWWAFDTDEAGIEMPYCSGLPVLSVYEQLLSMKHAVELAGLSKEDVERVFWMNAAEAFGVKGDWSGS